MEWFEAILFYSFTIILVGSALCVVMVKNPVHSVLFLVLSFFTGSALWLLLQAEFLAMILMLVYVGAVMVLFLFVVMMTDIDKVTLNHLAIRNLVVGTIVGTLIVVEMGAVIFRGFYHAGTQAPDVALKIGLTVAIGKSLFTRYLFQIELVAMLLLAALVGVVVLSLRRRNDAHYTPAEKAVRINPADRICLVEMEAEKTMQNSTADSDNSEGGEP